MSSYATQESDAATGIAIRGIGNLIAMHFSAKLEGMLSRGVRNVVDELGDGIGPLELRPLETAKSREEISAKTDARQSSGERPGHAGIKTVSSKPECSDRPAMSADRSGCIRRALHSPSVELGVHIQLPPTT